ncbi:ABC transporter substrate-binding protein [Acidaminococcus timonensis]|uniref:ABC transporter substrate-binding protein n=1 Tax=Acidaminococcus timonensis TaxID=1871002 RepID=UPI00248B88A4|nr:NrtA/SsuA/CpmA family ABC transporter substrate-binding protein [Acidaminococcus timonensis]
MMMKKKLMALLAVGALTLGALVAGCGSDKTAQKAAAPKMDKVSITYVQAPLNVPSIVEKANQSFEKKFKEKGVTAGYSTITSGADQTAALASGDIQFLNCVGGSSVLLSAANGNDIKIISLYSQAPKAFKLFSKDGSIKSAADLKGKTIAGPKGTILHELLAAYLQKAGLTMKDVKFVSMGLPAAASAMENGSADCALLAGPLAYNAEKKGMHVVTTGEGLVSGLTVTAVSGKFYKEHKDLVDTFLAVQKETLDFMQKNPDKALELTAKATELDPTAVKEMYPLYDFSMKITPEAIESLKKTQDFLVASGMMEKKVDVDALFVK